jgi:Holliday junction resolvasome RuvABC endonuclease subunit
MLILALDADTRNVGFAYGLDDGQYLCGGQTRFEGDDADERCWAIVAWIAKVLGTNRVECLAVEEPIVGPNARTALQLGRLGGMLEAVAKLAGAEVVRVHPSTAKAALAGGGAGKEEMMAAARLVASAVEGEHHADAVGVLFAAQGILKERNYVAHHDGGT